MIESCGRPADEIRRVNDFLRAGVFTVMPGLRFFVCLSAVTALTVTVSLSAQEGGGRQGARGFGPGASPLFMALDTDHDGSLSASEISRAPASLKSLDRNGDGRITPEEMPRMLGRGGREGLVGTLGRGTEGFPGRGGRDEGPGETRPTSADDLVSALMAFDANKDGKLTRAEVPERFQGLFDRADANKGSAAGKPQPADSTEGGRGEREGGRGEREGDRGERGGGPPMFLQDPLLAPLDGNGDGILSAEEIAGSGAALRKLDRNGDGILTPDELPAQGPGRGRD